jgi:hypothetical protein
MNGVPEASPGLRNGFRPRRVQTAEGELAVELVQVRAAAEPVVSRLFPRGTKLLRTEPLRAMVIGAFVRGSRCAMSSRCASRRGSASSPNRPHHGSAPTCASASSSSGAATSTTSTWPRCFGCDVSRRPPRRAKGGRAGRVGLHRRRRARAAGGDAGDARVPRGLAGARARSDRPSPPPAVWWPWTTARRSLVSSRGLRPAGSRYAAKRSRSSSASPSRDQTGAATTFEPAW